MWTTALENLGEDLPFLGCPQLQKIRAQAEWGIHTGGMKGNSLPAQQNFLWGRKCLTVVPKPNLHCCVIASSWLNLVTRKEGRIFVVKKIIPRNQAEQ